MSTGAVHAVDYTFPCETIEETLELHRPLILQVIKSLSLLIRSAHLEMTEVHQVASIGMWRAYNTFQRGKKAKWVTWAWIIIRQEIIDLAKDNRQAIKIPRHAYKHKDRIAAMPAVINKDISDMYCADKSVSVEDENNLECLAEKETMGLAIKYLEMVEPHQRQLLYLKFFKGLTYREISPILNLSHESLRQHCRRALLTLQKELGVLDEP